MRILTDLWRPHFKVLLTPPMAKPEFAWLETPQGIPRDVDILVSTLFHPELDMLPGFCDRPVVAYLQVPLSAALRDIFARCARYDWFHVIGGEPCYREETFWPCETFIPYACDPKRFKLYRGNRREVAIINKHPHKRWEICQRRAGSKELLTIPELLQDLPWRKVESPDWSLMWDEAVASRVLFEFNGSPYSCVLFEAMTAGMPIVGYNDSWGVEYHPLAHYLYDYSTNPEEIRKKLRRYLDHPPWPVIYPTPTFAEVRDMWIAYLESLL